MGGSAGKLKDALGDNSTQEQIKAAFDSYDKDKSGALDAKEGVPFLKDVQKILGKSKDPDVQKVAHEADPAAWFEKFADLDKDGKLTFKEFADWTKTVGTDADKVEKKSKEKKDKKDDKHKDDKHKDEKKDKDEKKEKKDKGDKDKDEKKEKKEKKDKK